MPIRKITPPPVLEESPPVRKPHGWKKKGLIILFLALILAVGASAWSYKNYLNVEKQLAALSTPEGQKEISQKQTQELVNKVGRLIMLPTDEEPTVATITDADSLKKEQQFYRDAKNGDQVLIYTKAKKAIIYNEAKDILVNVGPIFVNDSPATTPTK